MSFIRDITMLTGGMFISKLKENPTVKRAINEAGQKCRTGIKNAASFVVNVIDEIEKEEKNKENKESNKAKEEE